VISKKASKKTLQIHAIPNISFRSPLALRARETLTNLDRTGIHGPFWMRTWLGDSPFALETRNRIPGNKERK
jgi:hypothetical protein